MPFERKKMSETLILICTHGCFGQEIINSASMIVGEMKDVQSVSLPKGMDPIVYRQKIECVLEEAKDKNVFCMVDLFGGTPCNMAASLLSVRKFQIVSGLNLAMLLEVMIRRDYVPFEQLTAAALKALSSSGFDVGKRLKEMQLMKGEEKNGADKTCTN